MWSIQLSPQPVCITKIWGNPQVELYEEKKKNKEMDGETQKDIQNVNEEIRVSH